VSDGDLQLEAVPRRIPHGVPLTVAVSPDYRYQRSDRGRIPFCQTGNCEVFENAAVKEQLTMTSATAHESEEYPIRYLSARDVVACMPLVGQQLQLAEQAVVALARNEGENPPKIALHPREEAFLHAMPAYHQPSDRVGMKWVSGFPENRSRGLPYILGIMVLNDPETGRPISIMDCREITAARTAAISGVALSRLAPRNVSTVAVIGAGVQAKAHLPVLTHLFASLELVVCDAFPEAAEAFAEQVRDAPGVRSVRTENAVAKTVAGADVVITAGTVHKYFQDSIRPELMKADVLILAVDWTTLVKGPTAQAASLFVVDDVSQYSYHKGFGHDFVGCPDQVSTLGELVLDGVTRETRPRGLVIAMPLGVAMADLMFAHAIYDAAIRQGVGVDLEP